MTAPVIVLGAGVVGLSAALALAKSGSQVQIVTERGSAHVTSAVAGAVWEPYLAGGDRLLDWAADSLGWLRKLSTVPGAGVRIATARHVSRQPVAALPEWAGLVATAPAGDLPPGYLSGFEAEVPVVDMPVHLAWLESRLAEFGVPIEMRRVDTLAELPRGVVVNCAGAGAGALVGDPTVRPVRGQVLWVRNPGLSVSLFDLDDAAPERPTYVIAHGERLVLGGSATEGGSPEPDPAVSAEIRARCAELDPRVANAELLSEHVGFRPVRPTVRLAREQHAGRTVVHDYGHGGAGVTLAWGCAREVVRLLGGGSVRA